MDGEDRCDDTEDQIDRDEELVKSTFFSLFVGVEHEHKNNADEGCDVQTDGADNKT